MNNEELLNVKKYLGANLISLVLEKPEKASYEDIMVWCDLPYEKKWKHVPKGLTFTGESLIDVSLNEILTNSKYYIRLSFDFNFIKKYYDRVDWGWISKYQTLSEEFIEKYHDKVYWGYISLYQTLSEEFIEKYQDKVNWHCISKYQTLSEEFIEKHHDKVYWGYISLYQTLSGEFKERFKHILHE